jgi:hypothetical protein
MRTLPADRVLKIYRDHYSETLGYCTLTLKAIGERFGFSPQAIRECLKRLGVDVSAQPAYPVPLEQRHRRTRGVDSRRVRLRAGASTGAAGR